MRPLKPLQKGDIIYTDNVIYQHYGIYAGNGRVIHYAGEDSHFGGDICIQETSLEKFAKGCDYSVAQYSIDPSRSKQFSGEETVRRARSRIGEKSYNLLFNNCEHFALWCKYGKSRSVQVEKAVTTAVVIGAVALAMYATAESENGEIF